MRDQDKIRWMKVNETITTLLGQTMIYLHLDRSMHRRIDAGRPYEAHAYCIKIFKFAHSHRIRQGLAQMGDNM